ncbi:MAG: sensor histidine kinase [Candidatus Eiseniibacteriota bacterium]
MPTAPTPVPPGHTSSDAGPLELRILALRAELLQTLTPGIMHHLANAGQGLEAAESFPKALEQVALRLEKARRVVGTLVDDLAADEEAGASVDEILAEVEAWQSCQITLPRVRVVFDPHPPLPAARIRADYLRDALAAIVTNAKEAMAGTPAGEIHVAAAADSEWITITVIDEGPGINLTALARLFEPFNSTKTGGSHLGLGLSVARELLMRAGGDLSVSTSEEQPHTSIRMRIPIAPPEVARRLDFSRSGVHDPALPRRAGTPGGTDRPGAAA